MYDMQTKHEILTIRVEPEIDKKLHEVAKEHAKSKSEIVRKAITEYVARETEIEEIKRFIAKKFAENKISFDEVVRFLGYKEAQKVAFYHALAKKSFECGLE